MAEGMSMTRRGFVASLVAIPALGVAEPAGAGDREARFRALSARLTGFPEEAFDPVLARDLIDGLLAAGDGGGLERLLSETALDADEDLARRIVVAWYSGIHPTAEGVAVRAFREALVWQALDFTKPPGECSAAPGDWSRPPARTGA